MESGKGAAKITARPQLSHAFHFAFRYCRSRPGYWPHNNIVAEQRQRHRPTRSCQKQKIINYAARFSGLNQLLTFICSTPKKASSTMPLLILEVPRVRSVKMMGTSLRRKPNW